MDESAPVDWLPLVALVPLQAPLAAHEVALVEDQVKVAEPPVATEAGLAPRLTVGTGFPVVTVTVVDWLVVPPAPVQERV